MPRGDPAVTPVPSRLYLNWLRKRQRERQVMIVSRVALLALFLVLWEILPRAGIVNPMLTSYPSALWPAFLELLKPTSQSPGLFVHAWATLLSTIIGFSSAMLAGFLGAMLLWWLPLLRDVLDPYLVIANAMPKTAFVPLFYVWLGAELSIYGMSLAISLFITILMIYSGFAGVDPNKIKLARSFGATKAQILAKVVVPGSVPTMVATLKVTVGLSLVGVVVGEFQSASRGLGYLIQYGSQIYRMSMVMTAVVLLAIISSGLYVAIALLESTVVRRRGLTEPNSP